MREVRPEYDGAQRHGVSAVLGEGRAEESLRKREVQPTLLRCQESVW